MASSSLQDDSIDLEVSSQRELHRNPACDSDSQIIDLTAQQELQGPHGPRRCANKNRELLNNCFPADD